MTSLLIWLWPLYQLSQLPETWLSFLPARLYLFDGLILVLLLFKWHKVWQRISKHSLSRPLGLFIFIALLSLFIGYFTGEGLTPAQFGVAFMYWLRLVIYGTAMFLLIGKEEGQLRASFFLLTFLGLGQYLLWPDLRFLKTLGFDDHYFRLSFPFLDPNYMGAALAFIFLLSLEGIKKRSGRVLLVGSILALGLTFSRAGYLSLVVGLVFLVVRLKRLPFWALISLVLLALAVWLAPKPLGEGVNLLRTYSIESRLNSLTYGWELFVSRPLLGWGFNVLGFVREVDPGSRAAFGLDNSVLVVMATMGLAGLAAFGYLLLEIARAVRGRVFLQAGLLALLVHSLFNNSLFYAPLSLLIFICLGVFSGYRKR